MHSLSIFVAGQPFADLVGGGQVSWVPVLLLGVPGGVAVILLWLYARTARQHRRALMAPPVWLLPYLEKSQGNTGAAPDASHLELEDQRLASASVLARRKRLLLLALGVNFVTGWACAGVFLYTSGRPVDFDQLPSTLLLGPSVDTATFQGLEGRDLTSESAAPETVVVQVPDTAAERQRRAQQAAFLRQRDSLADARRRDSIALAEELAQRLRDSVLQAVSDSLERARASAPVVPPPPPPPPPPPAPDPSVERARAAAAIQARSEALVAAINSRQGVAELLGSGGTRDQFLRFVRERSPSATLGRVSEPILSVAGAAAQIVVNFQWRGPFGDTRRGESRFQVEAAPASGTWQVVNVVSLNTPQ